jgi:predicted DNA-binding transcriptional regulator YafY
VAGLSEIKRWVLGLGPEAIVKAPEELKIMVQADLERSLDQYNQGQLFQVEQPEINISGTR